MPALARAALASAEGQAGLLRTLLFEVSGPGADAELERELAIADTIAPLAAYVAGQMAGGRLRRMDPLLALLAFVGPLVMHLLTRDAMGRALGLDATPRGGGRRPGRNLAAGHGPGGAPVNATGTAVRVEGWSSPSAPCGPSTAPP